ncbi:SDR family NAD(P)-dependent oxidoreductase [Mycobacterium sp. TY815]|uniref:SDR family NAD(P)-dependent oxidoreductase n=1 Tax=Mycobacterium sp. TY815 TaxID=3050581 RepID=UPI0027414ED4|nr:SDR family oxidoreductase [Mycobacterium sp. TY815]MDP7707025.1 SDR family oxidoreductase [Mycobacterium sp. TY815]
MRKVVVTGGGSGIGRAVAAVFAAGGDEVVITGRRGRLLESTARELPGSVRALVVDGLDAKRVELVSAELGAVDVLVNNAGGNTDFDRPSPKRLVDIAAAWRSNMDANVTTAVLMTAALLPAMAAESSIITIGSIAADKGAGSYGAAKAAVASWNVDLARSVGDRGITANIVSPGYVADTEFFRDVLDDERRETLVNAAMTRRASKPADIAATVAFLASPGARQITGQTIAVNGGEWPSR